MFIARRVSATLLCSGSDYCKTLFSFRPIRQAKAYRTNRAFFDEANGSWYFLTVLRLVTTFAATKAAPSFEGDSHRGFFKGVRRV